MAVSLTDRIPIYKVRDDVLITKRGDWAVGFKITLREIFSLSSEDYEQLNRFFVNVVERMPDYSVIHKQDWFTTQKFKPNNKRGDSILGKYSDFKFLERSHVVHECFIYLIKTNKAVKVRSSGSNLFNSSLVPPESFDEGKFNEFYSDVASIEGLFKANTEYFTSVERMKAADYYDEEKDEGILPRYFTLSKQKQLVDIDFSKGMKIGTKHCAFHTIESLKQFPQRLEFIRSSSQSSRKNILSMFSFAHPVALNLKFDHIYNQYIFKDNFRETLREKELQKNRMSNFSSVSAENKANYEGLKQFLEASTSGYTPVRFHCNVLTFANSEAELSDHSILVGNGFTEMGLKARQNVADNRELYWAGCPGNGSDVPAENTCTLFAEQAASFFNLETSYADSNSDFGIRLCERESGYPLHVDLFFEPLKKGIISNRNVFVVGPSGSGKSFCTNTILAHVYDHQHHMVLVDMGRSYKRLCELNNGIFIDFTPEKPLKFNPFFLDPMVGLTDDKIENLKALIFTLWLDDEPTKLQDNVLREHIVNYYKLHEKHKNFMLGFHSFYDFILATFKRKKEINPNSAEFEFFDYENFAITTRSYYRGGIYEDLLNNHEQIDFTHNRLIVFELESIKDNPTLLSIYTLMIMDTYINKLFRLPGENIMKTLLMEEAWKALMNAKMAAFLLYCVKTVRKYYGQLITVTQELEDLLGNPFVKKALVGNSDIKILLDQGKYKDGFNQVKELLGLTDHEANLVLSLNTLPAKGRVFKEMYVKLGILSKVYGIEVSEMEYAAFSTNKDETDIIYRYQSEKGGELIPALQQFVEDRELKKLK